MPVSRCANALGALEKVSEKCICLGTVLVGRLQGAPQNLLHASQATVLWGLGLGVTEIWFYHASLPVSKFAAQKLHLLHGIIETPSEILWGQVCSPETTVGEKGPQPDPW